MCPVLHIYILLLYIILYYIIYKIKIQNINSVKQQILKKIIKK